MLEFQADKDIHRSLSPDADGHADDVGQRAPLQDLSGNNTRMSPEWSATLRPSYEFSLGNGGTLGFEANAIYKSEQYHSEFNDERLSSDDYTIFDAYVMYTSPGERYSVNLWGKNLTDEFVWAGSYAVASTRTIGGTLLPPRTYGVTMSMRF